MIFYNPGRGRYAARFSGGGGVGCLIFGILGLIAAYYILKGLFIVLYWAAPALFVLALIVNWRAVTDTFKDWFKTLENNPLNGLLIAAIAVLAFPVLALYLFVKSLGYRKIAQMQRNERAAEGEFVEFEELESRPKEEPDRDEPVEPAAPPEKEPPAEPEVKKPENPYDRFFGN